jgi:hypothetical protein
MRLSPLLPRLESVPDLSGRVDIAVNVAEVLAEHYEGPRAWLVEPRGASQPTSTVQVITQRREQRFGVLLLLSFAAGTGAQAALEAMETLRAAMIAALLGAEPDSGYDPVEHSRDGLARWADGNLYWLDEFRTGHLLTNR